VIELEEIKILQASTPEDEETQEEEKTDAEMIFGVDIGSGSDTGYNKGPYNKLVSEKFIVHDEDDDQIEVCGNLKEVKDQVLNWIEEGSDIELIKVYRVIKEMMPKLNVEFD